MAPSARLFPFIAITIMAAACDGRAVPELADGTTSPVPDGPVTSPPPDATPVKLDAAVDAPVLAPTACQQLVVVNKVNLGQIPGSNADSPAIAYDGKGHFGVVWIGQHSATDGSDPDEGPALRFSRVSLGGKATNPTGIKIGWANKKKPLLQPELHHQGKEYAVLYNAASGNTTLAHFDDQGAVLSQQTGIGGLTHATTTPHPKGYAVLYVNPYVTELKIAQFAYAGSLYLDKLVHKGEAYWYLWLTDHKSGYTATWGKRFARLDHLGVLQEQPKTAIAQDFVSASSWVAHADGSYAVAYARVSDLFIELLRLDAMGKPLGPPVPVDRANISSAPIKQLSLLWTGSHYILVYPPQLGIGAPACARLLDASGKPVGQPVKLPHCLSFSMLAGAAAWGDNRLAVATVDGFSGPPWSGICVSVLACQ